MKTDLEEGRVPSERHNVEKIVLLSALNASRTRPPFGSTLQHAGERRVRVIIARPPERREAPAEVQFEVARNTVTDTAELGTARLRTGPAQGCEEHVVARLKLGSCRRPEPIDLGLRRGQRFTVERGQTPDERIDERVVCR